MLSRKMPLPRYLSLLIAGFLWTGCLAQGTLPQGRAPLAQDGEMDLFLQPVPQEAAGLKIVIDQCFVLHSDGRRTEIPLSLSEFNAAALNGIQKKIASVVLPPGLYNGIALKLKGAAKAGREVEEKVQGLPQ